MILDLIVKLTKVTNPVPVSLGVDCDINIDECESNPCENGAECIDGINEYICACKPGFDGGRCEVDINECEKYSPCQNDARCIGEFCFVLICFVLHFHTFVERFMIGSVLTNV